MDMLELQEYGKHLNKIDKNITMNKVLLLAILILLSRCTRNTKSPKEMDPQVLKNEILKNGDKKSFTLLFNHYVGKKMDDEFLNISKLMYHKYKINDVFSIIYDSYIYKYNQSIPFLKGSHVELIKNLPEVERDSALSYLKLGISIGDNSSIEYMAEYYLSIGEAIKSKELLEFQEQLILEHRKKINDSLK